MNLNIRKKLMALLLFPLIFLLLLIFIQLRTLYKDYVQASKISKLVYVINDISNLVHETQVERGMSSGFLGSGGILYKEELKLQRTKSDKAYMIFKNRILDLKL